MPYVSIFTQQKIKKMKKLIKSILLILIPVFGLCQGVELISSENSELPEDNIWSIGIDSSGAKWIGTSQSGLVRYKNEEFTIYNDSTSNFKGSYISPLHCDSNGKVWVNVSKPDKLYVIENDQFKEIKNEVLKKLGGVIAIAEDQNGVIYFGGMYGVVKFENNTWTKIALPSKSLTVRAIAVSNNGELAVGHNRGLIIIKEGEFEIFEVKEGELQLSVVRGLRYMDDDKLIIGYGGGRGNGGFSIKAGSEWTHYNRDNARIVDHMVRDIEVDKDNIYWMATNEGLTFLREGIADTVFFREGRMKNTIMDIAIHENEIWVATNFGVIQIKK